jgi:predicted nucleic acid-binding protein
VKRYVIEEGSRRVQEWLKKGPIVATSSLALIEVMSTLVRKERAGELDVAKMEASLETVEEDFERLASVPLSSGVTNNARVLSRRYGLRGGRYASSGSGSLDCQSTDVRGRSNRACHLRP